MNKVFMRTFNDCQTAVYATILQVPYEEVPRLYTGEDEIVENWREVREEFLNSKGLYCVVFEASVELARNLKGKFIAGVESCDPEYREKGYEHAVIFENGSLWHDPNPKPRTDNLGLADIRSIELLIPIFGGNDA